MNMHYICWVENEPDTLKSFDDHVQLLETDHGVKFIIDPHLTTNDFDVIARNINDNLIFFIDYNLKTNEGDGIDGNEVIQKIREHNTTCKIVFYSSNATQEELRSLIQGLPNVKCVLREDLFSVLTDIANGSFSEFF